MADEKKRDWIDIVDVISKLLIPVVIALGGILYSAYQSNVDERRRIYEKGREEDRQNLQRDTDYVKMLLSKDSGEKTLGIDIITVMSRRNRFSPALVAVLTIMAADDQNKLLAEAARRILVNQQEVSNVKASDSKTTVYIQISEPGQKDDAKVLQDALRNGNFTAPGIELVTGKIAAAQNYVRFFAASDREQANRVKDMMSTLGYTPPIVQDFSARTKSSLSPIEVWIGKTQGSLPKSPGP
jgi:hypothetical protein